MPEQLIIMCVCVRSAMSDKAHFDGARVLFRSAVAYFSLVTDATQAAAQQSVESRSSSTGSEKNWVNNAAGNVLPMSQMISRHKTGSRLIFEAFKKKKKSSTSRRL